MTQVNFYESVDDSLLKFAVIIAKSTGRWVLCKHKERTTYEVPGGHREEGESIEETARRELYEETGALEYTLKPISVYSVIKDGGQETFGMLYYAEVTSFEEELHSEIEYILLLSELDENWTYPEIQPRLIEKVREKGIV